MDTLQARYEALSSHWLAIVAAARSLGADAQDLNTVGVLISGRGEAFGRLRLPVRLEGITVADISSPIDAEPGGFVFDFVENCPLWVQRLVSQPHSHPLAY